jgi:hypothetical protein
MQLEVAFDVHIHHMHESALQQFVHAPECIFATASGSEPVAGLTHLKPE